MNQYYLWCVLNDVALDEDKLQQGRYHAKDPQDAWGHFLEDLHEQNFEESDILFRGGCEVTLTMSDEPGNIPNGALPSIKLLREAELHDNRH